MKKANQYCPDNFLYLWYWSGPILLFFLFTPVKAEKPSAAPKHPIHISVSTVAYNPRTQSIEIVHKLFIDDLEDHLEQGRDLKLHLGSTKEHPKADELIRAYLEKHFQIALDGQKRKPDFIGRESDLQAMWVYQELPQIEANKSITVHSSFLYGLFADQQNLIHVDYQNHQKSFLQEEGGAPGQLSLVE